MMRKYLAVLLCVLIAVTFIPVTAFAAGEGTPDEPAALDNAAIAENFAQTPLPGRGQSCSGGRWDWLTATRPLKS